MTFWRQQTTRKYGNKKVVYDGHVFDSDVECEYYKVLKSKQEAGEIFNLTLKPEFPLMVNYLKITERAFCPDFMWTTQPLPLRLDQRTIHEIPRNIQKLRESVTPIGWEEFCSIVVVKDTKGYLDPTDAATRIFEMKRKLVQAIYGITVEIVQTQQAQNRQEKRKAKKSSDRAILRRLAKQRG